MRKILVTTAVCLALFSCQKKEERLYTIGLFQVDDAPTLNAVRRGFLSALEEAGLMDGVNVRLIIRNG
ncbi:MAG: hypothetical protein ACE5LV_03225, partial [Candidatus Aminicenantales bacterium]